MTNAELIAEARKWAARFDSWEEKVTYITALASALERTEAEAAAMREQVVILMLHEDFPQAMCDEHRTCARCGSACTGFVSCYTENGNVYCVNCASLEVEWTIKEKFGSAGSAFLARMQKLEAVARMALAPERDAWDLYHTWHAKLKIAALAALDAAEKDSAPLDLAGSKAVRGWPLGTRFLFSSTQRIDLTTPNRYG